MTVIPGHHISGKKKYRPPTDISFCPVVDHSRWFVETLALIASIYLIPLKYSIIFMQIMQEFFSFFVKSAPSAIAEEARWVIRYRFP